MLPTCYMVKASANAWTQRYLDGQLSPEALRRLVPVSGDQLTPRERYIGSTDRIGRLSAQKTVGTKRIKYGPDPINVFPFQSPGQALGTRIGRSAEAQDWLEDNSQREINSRNALQARNGWEPEVVEKSNRVGASHFNPRTREISVPLNNEALSVMDLRKFRNHEAGHYNSSVVGAGKRVYYDLQDRLLVHRMEKRAPGVVMGPLREGTDHPRGLLIEEATAEAHASKANQRGWRVPLTDKYILHGKPGSIQADDALNQLRINYGRNIYRPLDLLGRVRDTIKTMPVATQVLALDPINARGGKKIPGNLLNIGLRALRRGK